MTIHAETRLSFDKRSQWGSGRAGPPLPWSSRRADTPVSREIFAPVRKSPLAKGGDFFMHAEHEKFDPRRFIHDHRLWENRPYIVWPWEIHLYDEDFLNGGDCFTWWIKRFCHEEIAPHAANMTNGSFLFILGTLIANCIFISSHNIKLLKHYESILWCLILF